MKNNIKEVISILWDNNCMFKKLFLVISFILFIALTIVNIVIGFLCVWINYNIIQLSVLITLAYIITILIFLKKNTNKNLPISLKILSISLVLILCFISYTQSPKYLYNEAQNIIVNNTNNQFGNIHLGDPEIKTIRTLQNLNIFINKGYVILIKNDSDLLYYFFNPINGDYKLINNIS